MSHIPVLLQEAVSYLSPRPGGIYIDMTIGLGGHAYEILSRSGHNGRVIGFEQDIDNVRRAQKNLSQFTDRVTIIPKNFCSLSETLRELDILQTDGILFDLGISSPHLDNPERGFSFRKEGPLDMRMSTSMKITAADIINTASEAKLLQIFWEFGEEKQARFFVRKILERRIQKPFMTTVDLAEYINQHSYKGIRTGGGHPAAQIFQALRIAVNQELHVLEQTLPQTLPFLKKGARLVIIAFHSLEDRIVKKFLRQYSARSKNQKYPRNAITKKDTPMLHILTNKAIQPSEDEIRKNPRARSARMRVAERII